MKYFPLSIRGLHIAFLLFILLFLYAVFNFYSQEKTEELTVQASKLQTLGKIKTDYLEDWYRERMADGLFLFYNLPNNDDLKQLLLNSSRKDSAALASYLSYMAKNHNYENIFILGTSGELLLQLNSESAPLVQPLTLDSAITIRRPVMSTIYKDSASGVVGFDIYVPLFMAEKLSSILVLKLDPGKSLFPAITSWQQASFSGESIIVFTEKDSILYLIPKESESGFNAFKLPVTKSGLIASKIVQGEEGTLQGVDYGGTEVLADIRNIDNGNWYLITKLNLTEIFLPVKKSFINNLLILCLVVFLGSLALLYYHTRVNFNHLKQISESEDKLKFILEHSTNLFYSHTTENVFTYVSPQSYSILGFKPEELMVSWKTLLSDNKVNSVGAELTEKAIRTGQVQRPYELELLRKDGTKIWVEVREAPVLKDGKTVQIVGSLTPLSKNKMAEKALYETEEIFRHFMENSPIYVFFKDEELRALKLSNNYEDMLGRPLDEIIGKKMDEIFPPELAAQMIEVDKSILRENKTVIVNEQLNGRYYTTIKFPIYIDGESRYLAGYTIDITERALGEQALRESEEKHRQLFENMLDGVYKSTPEGKFIEVNPAMVKMLGYDSKEDLLAIDIKTQLYFEEEDRQSAVLEELSKEMAVFRLKKKDGSEIWVEDHGLYTRDENGNVLFYEGILRDITERRAAEERITTLNQALEQSPLSAFITDTKGCIEYVNPKFTELCGYTFEEILGEEPRIIKSGEFSEEEYNEFWSILREGKEWRGEVLNKKKNGELYWVNGIVSPILNERGDIIHYIGLEEDITEKKKIVEELIIQKEKAEEVNRLKSYFFANMSHELRTPFVGIIGYAELLLQITTDEESRDMLNSILDSSNRLMDTLNKILTLTKLEFEPPKYSIKCVDINEILEDCQVTFHAAAAKKKLALQVNRYPEPLFINTDERLLMDILCNLVSNAIKYTDKGSIMVHPALIHRDGEDFVRLTVADTGIGIPKEKHDQIWLAFRQVSEGFDRSFQGTGLGLTITKKYAELLGASINVQSEHNFGSSFTIELPVAGRV